MGGVNSIPKEVKHVKIWLVCPRCETGAVVHRSKSRDFKCKRCGGVFIADFQRQVTIMADEQED